MNTSVLIKKDNHEEDIAILMDKLHGIPKKGIIHIGAHKGEEYEEYIKRGFQNIIFIEANPELCQLMTDRFSKDRRVKVYNYAITDITQEIEFHLHQSNSGLESSSILKMKEFDKIVTSLKTSKTIRVPGITLADFITKENLAISNYNVLSLDIQGADYYALRGANEILQKFDAVITEVQCIELYENSVNEKVIDEYMDSQKYERFFTIYHELYNASGTFPAWGEVIYVKKNR
ncbi:MAG: FkbM family methyltransferase [Bacteroidia bacterium]